MHSFLDINDWVNKDKVLKNETQIDVETLSLVDLLTQNNAPSLIDYLSLDTEGTELEILQSNDYEKYKGFNILSPHELVISFLNFSFIFRKV